MSGRNSRARIASETVAITQAGEYTSPGGKRVSMAESIRAAVDGSKLYRPGDTPMLRGVAEQAIVGRGGGSEPTRFEVVNETTFATARRLVARFEADRVAALNFASARNPGGGFLNGSQAQEESLARASALYPCLLRHSDYYDANRREVSPLYTDHLIVSPRVPVFRDDADRLLEEPWAVTILTSPAPNAGAVRQEHRQAVDRIEPTFRRRVEQVLAAAIAFEQTAIVLGAWGCGVFRNDPAVVAGLFGEFLLTGGPFANAFEQVAFAVLDRGNEIIAPFERVFRA